MSTKNKRKSISLRTIHTLLVFGAVLMSTLMFYSTHFLFSSYESLTENSEQAIELRNASLELSDASDYMTERVQRFALSGNPQFMKEYFDEAFLAKHREEAIQKMSAGVDSTAALEKLSSAMESSEHLMEREYYAFRLVVEAKGYEDYPEQLDGVILSERDKALSAEEKMNRAADIVFDNDYYSQKHQIHENMEASLDELEKLVTEKDTAEINEMRSRLLFVHIMILIETLAVFFLIWLASHLGINPIIRAVDRIKNNTKIPEAGTTEFRYLVRAYNQLYEVYRKSLDRLDFKASHDELTGVYNRAGYDSLLSEIDLDTTYMMLFDVDNFKSINDTYGHEIGDKVLVKFADILKSNFRPDDFICRIGGDEFVVLMLHTKNVQQELIGNKIDIINQQLNSTGDGLPSVSISVGIMHGSEAQQTEDLFKKTDEAMYDSKQKGKSTYTFYSSDNT